MIVRLTSESRQDPAGVEDAGVVDQEPGAAVPPGDAQDIARRVLDEATTPSAAASRGRRRHQDPAGVEDAGVVD